MRSDVDSLSRFIPPGFLSTRLLDVSVLHEARVWRADVSHEVGGALRPRSDLTAVHRLLGLERWLTAQIGREFIWIVCTRHVFRALILIHPALLYHLDSPGQSAPRVAVCGGDQTARAGRGCCVRPRRVGKVERAV